MENPDARQMTCYRLKSDRYTLALQAEGDAVVAQPDVPGLLVSLTELWR